MILSLSHFIALKLIYLSSLWCSNYEKDGSYLHCTDWFHVTSCGIVFYLQQIQHDSYDMMQQESPPASPQEAYQPPRSITVGGTSRKDIESDRELDTGVPPVDRHTDRQMPVTTFPSYYV